VKSLTFGQASVSPVVVLHMTRIAFAALFAVVIAELSLAGGFLTTGGAIVQCVMASVLFGLGGWQYIAPIAIFFVLSSLLSGIRTRTKREAERLSAKGSRRDAKRVLANGGTATITVVIGSFAARESLYIAYLDAVAAATADTWGTEVGSMGTKLPYLITAGLRVPPGTSGAVSIQGSFAGLIGTAAIWFSGVSWIAADQHWNTLIAVSIGGLAGSFSDSLLGSTLQAGFRCSICQITLEQEHNCGIPCVIIRGIRAVNNDVVNASCTIVGAIVPGLLYSI
jgi:uncharacterized protein (TIGR00297 family)